MNEPKQITAFGITIKLLWQPIPITIENGSKTVCSNKHFYLSIDDVANYLVLPEENSIIIEKNNPNVSFDIIATWLLGTVFAYLLQYHGYLVLHGSAVIINGKAVVFSGDSGAGKSTLAAAFADKGYTLLTDDVVVITPSQSGALVIIPGPAKVKLWQDAFTQLNIQHQGLKQIINKKNKFELPLPVKNTDHIEISNFYELNMSPDTEQITCQRIDGVDKLQTLIKNTYRYNMLKPLGQLKHHLHDCGLLARQIKIKKIVRPQEQYLLKELVALIEKDLEIQKCHPEHELTTL